MHRWMRITINREIAKPSKGEAKTLDRPRHKIEENICFRCEVDVCIRSHIFRSTNLIFSSQTMGNVKNIDVALKWFQNNIKRTLIKPWRRRRQGRATPSKEGFIFHLRISQLSWSFYRPIGLKSCSIPAISSNGKFEKLVIVARVLQNI